MTVVTIDYETYYSQDYSLSKMSEIDYIMSPLFQTIMCSVKIDAAPAEVFIGDAAVRRRLAAIDWSRAALLAHNVRFDGAIAAWRYGVRPQIYLDTLSMARALTAPTIGKSSLAAVSAYLGLPPKGHEVVRALGKRLEMFEVADLAAYADYCLRDCENTYEIFRRFLKVFPPSELRLVDSVARMFIEPQAQLDAEVLAAHLFQVQAAANAIMAQVRVDKTALSSNQQFAALLESKGVEVPRKVSKTTGALTYALAKNDRGFIELLADASQPLEVQVLLAARVNAKSTQEETRTKKLLNLSLREWPDGVRGWAPVPLKYYGAHTGRLSGDGGFNWQNFKRGSPIRRAVVAPKGWRVLHRDASQIEARMVAWLARCRRLLEAFAEGRDVYSEFATMFYRMMVTKRDKPRRFVGKTAILGLGYGMGPDRFRHTCFVGNGGMSVDLSEKESSDLVYFYRDLYPEIPLLWALGEGLLARMFHLAQPWAPGRPKRVETAVGDYPCIIPGPNCGWMPNGMALCYKDLRPVRQVTPNGRVKSGWQYTGPFGEDVWLNFGGKVLENVSQALARIIVTDIAERVRQRTDYQPFLTTHDSLDYIVPVEDVAAMDALLDEEFTYRPHWAPDLPLASEGGWGVNLLVAESENDPEHNR